MWHAAYIGRVCLGAENPEDTANACSVFRSHCSGSCQRLSPPPPRLRDAGFGPHGQVDTQDGKLGTEAAGTSSSADSVAPPSGQRWWEGLSLVQPEPQLSLADSWIPFEVVLVHAFPVVSDTRHYSTVVQEGVTR